MHAISLEWYNSKGETISPMEHKRACFRTGYTKDCAGFGYIPKFKNLTSCTKPEALEWLQDLKELGLWVNQEPKECLKKFVFKFSDWGDGKILFPFTAILCGGTFVRYIEEEGDIIRKYLEFRETIPDITKIQALQLAHYKAQINNVGHTALACGHWGGNYLYKYTTVEDIKKRYFTADSIYGVFQDPTKRLIAPKVRRASQPIDIHKALL